MLHFDEKVICKYRLFNRIVKSLVSVKGNKTWAEMSTWLTLLNGIFGIF